LEQTRLIVAVRPFLSGYKIGDRGIYKRLFHAEITPETFNTPFAKKLAKERYKFVEQFVDRFLKEWNGEL